MSADTYKKEILERLIKKYQIRSVKNIITSRKISLKPTEIYKNYTKNNANTQTKQDLYEAAVELLSLGFITVNYLKFSEDIETLFLCDTKVGDIYKYLNDRYGIVPHLVRTEQINQIIERYIHHRENRLVRKYCDDLLLQIKNPKKEFALERIEANLKMLTFLEDNTEDLYLREVSMMVYGDSKWFENNNYDEIGKFLKSVAGETSESDEKNDLIFERFHIIPNEQELFIKGNWDIEWDNFYLDVSKLKDGIALSTGDIRRIKQIHVNSATVMTIENKTSFHRLNNSTAAKMYLGGFANRDQTDFLKKVYRDNPTVIFQHFGDIDIGGFRIHQHLCRMTEITFELYHMGIEQLMDARFKMCLKELTENDLNNMGTLIDLPEYRNVLCYMKANNVKLEQEIISYYLEKH